MGFANFMHTADAAAAAVPDLPPWMEYDLNEHR